MVSATVSNSPGASAARLLEEEARRGLLAEKKKKSTLEDIAQSAALQALNPASTPSTTQPLNEAAEASKVAAIVTPQEMSRVRIDLPSEMAMNATATSGPGVTINVAAAAASIEQMATVTSTSCLQNVPLDFSVSTRNRVAIETARTVNADVAQAKAEMGKSLADGVSHEQQRGDQWILTAARRGNGILSSAIPTSNLLATLESAAQEQERQQREAEMPAFAT